MYIKAQEVRIEKGIHARPSAKITEYALSKPNTHIWIEYPKEGTFASAGSVVDILTLCVPFGSTVIIKSEGEEEKEAALHIARIIEDFKP